MREDVADGEKSAGKLALGAVRTNGPRSIVFVLSAGSSEEGFVLFLQWRVLPFPL